MTKRTRTTRLDTDTKASQAAAPEGSKHVVDEAAEMHVGGAFRMPVEPDYFRMASQDELARRAWQMAQEGAATIRDLDLTDFEGVPGAVVEHFEYYDFDASEYVIAWRIRCRPKGMSTAH